MNKWSSHLVHRFAVLAILGLSATSIPLTASAQDAGASDEGLDEVIVTARKRAESLQEIPVAITAFSGEQLKEAGITSARDLYENTPGLNYDTGFDQNAGTPAIRGVTSSEIATYRQKVTTFLDGMPMLGQQGSVPFNAIEQVVVLRGPQSAAFGRSTFGGAINFKTRGPGETFEGEVNVDAGSNSKLYVDGLISGPIGDNVGFLVAASSNQIDGESHWKTEAEGETLGGQDSQNLLAKLVFTPSDNSSIELRYKWLDVDNEQTPRINMPLNDPNQQLHPDSPVPVCGGGIVPPPQPSCAYIGNVNSFDAIFQYNYERTGIEDPFVRNQRDRYEIDANFDLSNSAAIQVMGFYSDESYERAADMTLFDDYFGFERDPTDIEETYAEFRYVSPDDQKFRYSVGASYYDYDFLTNIYRSAAAYNTDNPTQTFSEAATNTGLFFNLTYDITDRTTVSFEGRWQSDEVSGIASDGYKLSETTDAFLPRISLTFSPTDATTFYIQAAQGNNPAGNNIGAVDPAVVYASESYPDIFDYQAIAFYEEEEIFSIEAGVKGSIGDRGTYAVNIYSLDWENYTQPFNLNFEPDDFIDIDNDGIGDPGTPYEGMDFGPGRSFLGAGDVTGAGLELEGTYLVTDDFRIGLVASYIDITYDNGACSTLPMNFGVPPDETTSSGLDCVEIGGKELGTQPKLSGSLNLEYNHEMSNGLNWFARWNTRYTSSQYVSSMNLAEVSAYSITDLRVGLGGDAWRGELYVTNLFDEDAVQGPNYFFDARILHNGVQIPDPENPGGFFSPPAPPPFAHNVNYTERRGQAFGARFSYYFGR